jgi:hypothetical protein
MPCRDLKKGASPYFQAARDKSEGESNSKQFASALQPSEREHAFQLIPEVIVPGALVKPDGQFMSLMSKPARQSRAFILVRRRVEGKR